MSFINSKDIELVTEFNPCYQFAIHTVRQRARTSPWWGRLSVENDQAAWHVTICLAFVQRLRCRETSSHAFISTSTWAFQNITHASLQQSSMPSAKKIALVKPLLKKQRSGSRGIKQLQTCLKLALSFKSYWTHCRSAPSGTYVGQ